jgi:hypothetical protein
VRLIVVWIHGDGGGERDSKDKVCGALPAEASLARVCVCARIGGNAQGQTKKGLDEGDEGYTVAWLPTSTKTVARPEKKGAGCDQGRMWLDSLS